MSLTPVLVEKSSPVKEKCIIYDYSWALAPKRLLYFLQHISVPVYAPLPRTCGFFVFILFSLLITSGKEVSGQRNALNKKSRDI